MKQIGTLALAAAALLGSVTWASAQEAFTTNDVNMRAGPGSRFPVVTTIPADRQVYIHGCLSNWDWCDVSWRRNRGWVFSDNLEAVYRNRRLTIYDYRGVVDIPVANFGFIYWDRYYRNRPWFDEWDRWGDRRDRMRWHRQDRDNDWDNQQGGRTMRGDREDARRNDMDTDRPPYRKRNDRVGDCDGPNPSPACDDRGDGDRDMGPDEQ